MVTLQISRPYISPGRTAGARTASCVRCVACAPAALSVDAVLLTLRSAPLLPLMWLQHPVSPRSPPKRRAMSCNRCATQSWLTLSKRRSLFRTQEQISQCNVQLMQSRSHSGVLQLTPAQEWLSVGSQASASARVGDRPDVQSCSTSTRHALHTSSVMLNQIACLPTTI